MKQILSYSTILVLAFFSCTKPKLETPAPYKLSEITDSVIYQDLKFGITRNELLMRISSPAIENIMSEPIFDTNVVEVEDRIVVDQYPFRVFYYFEIDDSLYRVRAEHRCENAALHKRACFKTASIIYLHYGIPKRWKTIPGSYKFSWDLKNKQIFLECGCFMSNCLLEVMITEIRLFIKNRDRIIPERPIINH